MGSKLLDKKTAESLIKRSKKVLQENDLGESTKPTPHLYPHQWLWDSCFIAIGLRHYNIERAKLELETLVKGQWKNGFIAHETYWGDRKASLKHRASPDKTRAYLLPDAPKHVKTSGMTQPPVIADATVRVGEKLSKKARLDFYKKMYPHIRDYHLWWYRERDPHGTGLVSLIHAWESGCDDIPYWVHEYIKAAPLTVRIFQKIVPEDIYAQFRQDTSYVTYKERPLPINFYALYRLLAQTRELGYDYKRIELDESIPVLQDIIVNSILIRANHNLKIIAKEIGEELPKELVSSFDKAPVEFEELFSDGQYWSREPRSNRLIKTPTFGTFFALYAGTIPKERAEILADLMQKNEWWPNYGITSAPINSKYYWPKRFWQGPVWVAPNWLIADGLDRYGYHDVANRLRKSALELLAADPKMHEYFDAKTGSPAGVHTFSWSAALAIDMLESA